MELPTATPEVAAHTVSVYILKVTASNGIASMHDMLECREIASS